MALDSFIFGGNTGLTYEQLKRRRAIATALASQRRGYPKTVGEGLTYLGESIGDTLAERRLDAAERAQGIIDRAALNPPTMTAPAAPASAPVRPAAPAIPISPSARPTPPSVPVRPPPTAPRVAPTVSMVPVTPSAPDPYGATEGTGPEFAPGGILNPAPVSATGLEPVFPGEEGARPTSGTLSSGYLDPAAAAPPSSTPRPMEAAPSARPLPPPLPASMPVTPGEPAPGERTGMPGPQTSSEPPPNVLAQAQQVALKGGPAAVSQFMTANGYPQSGAWCGQFAASVLSSSGLAPPEKAAVASNWRNIGTPVDIPQVGDIAVARPGWAPRRGSGETGEVGSHVTFVNQADPSGTFQGLGGNQGRMVKPFNAGDFEFRRLPGDVQGHRIIGIPGEEPPEVQVAAYAPTGGVSDAPVPGMGGAGSPRLQPQIPPLQGPPPAPEETGITPTDIEPMPRTAQFGPPTNRFTRSDAPVSGLPVTPPAPAPAAPVAASPSPPPGLLPPMRAGEAVPPPIEPMDPGPEPRPPGKTPEMLHYQNVASDPKYSDQTRAEAARRHDEALKAQREDFTRQWTIWKTEKLKFDDPATRLKLRHEQVTTEKAIRDLEGEGFMPLTPAELAGLPKAPEGQIIYKNRRGELKFGPTPPATTNIKVGGEENKGVEAIQKKLGESFVEMLEQGSTAVDDLRNLSEMRRLSGRVDTGGAAVAKSYLGRLGIKTEGISDIEAYNAMINRLTPQQRIPGTGATSDFDASMFKQSIPALVNTRGGNAMIMDTMEGLAKNKLDRSEIAGAVISGEITMKEGVKRMIAAQVEARALSDRVKAHLEATVPPAAAPASGGPIRVQTPEEASKLPSGTPIILPDGSTGRVP